MKKSTFIITCFCCIIVTATIIVGLFLFFKDDKKTEPIKVEKEEKETETDAELSATVNSDTPEEVVEENTVEDSTSKESFNIWLQVPDTFTFCSGVGSWDTTIVISDDGSFTGSHHDSNMGEYGPEYPNGTVYICNFTGKFTTPEKVTDTVYSMKLESMSLERPEGQEYYSDGMKFITTGPYGLDNPNIIYLYLPGTPRSYLSEGFLSWIHYDVYDVLPAGLYGLYNIQDDTGFESYTATGQ